MMGTFSTNVIFDEMSRRRCLGIRDILSKITFVENVPIPRQNTFSERKCRASGVWAVKTPRAACDSLTGVFRRAGLFRRDTKHSFWRMVYEQSRHQPACGWWSCLRQLVFKKLKNFQKTQNIVFGGWCMDSI